MSDQPPPPSSPYLQAPPPGAGQDAGAATAPPAPNLAAPGPPQVAVAPGIDGPWGPLADWGVRVVAAIVDGLVQLIGLVPYGVGIGLIIAGAGAGSRYDADTMAYQPPQADRGLVVSGIVLVVLGLLLMLAINLWNRAFKQGRTGQSVGKKAMGIKLVDERSGRPIGAGMSFVRDLCHALDGMAYVGYVWPLWDPKRQTFADKIIGTVVVRVPRS